VVAVVAVVVIILLLFAGLLTGLLVVDWLSIYLVGK